ncbi:MAG: branched-chain amino acid ABC transporter permease [Janthinobacterium lividum]
MSTSTDRVLTVILLVLLPILCLVTGNAFYKSLLIYSALNATAAVGLCLMLGFAGQISLGQAAFSGIGAYATSLLTSRLGLEPVLSIACGAVLSMAVGWMISRPLARMHDNYLAMATIAFGVVMYVVFVNLRPLTGGLDPGISVQKFSVLGIDASSPNALFGLAWVALAFAVLLAHNIASTKIGRSLRAMRMSRAAASSVGIDVVRTKSFVFAVGTLLTGLSGGVYAFVARSFNASTFSVDYSIELLMMVVIGSLNRVSGAIAGAVVITALPFVFDSFDDYKTLVFGLTMVIVMKYMPTGLVDAIFRLFSGRALARRRS